MAGLQSMVDKMLMCLVVVLVLHLKSLPAQQAFSDTFYSTYIEPLYDEFGFEVEEDQLLEIADMRSTSLGIGLGQNYTLTNIPRPPELEPPLLPQAILSFPPLETARQESGSVGSSQSSRSFPNYNSFPHRRFKRQAGFDLDNPFGDHLFEPKGDFFRDPVPSTFTSSKGRFDIGGSFGNFPSLDFGPSSLGKSDSKKCAPEMQMQCDPRAPYRTIDGSCNNLENPKWGAINQPMRRLLPSQYFDGFDVPRLTSKSDHRRLLPSARMVSRNVHEPSALKGHNLPELTNLVQVWGQFFAHDISGTPAHKAPDGRDLKCCDGVFLTESQQIHRDAFNGGRCNPIYIPPMDRHFTYSCMNFARSMAHKRKRDCDTNAPKETREQMNMLTAWVDASLIYGSSMKRADQLRVFHKGLLRVTADDLLPEDVNSTCVKEGAGDYCFLAGEKRVNEHPGLMALHIVFQRYHNRLALKMAEMNPRWTDETIYQEVRRIMGAIMQHVTYHDWLPTVLGPSVMRQYGLNVLGPSVTGPNYWRYVRTMNPTITNVFATAAFRFGHTMIPSLFTMGDEQVRLFTMFNRPKFILKDRGRGLQQMCSGMISDPVHHSDRFMSSDLSDRLFEDKDNVSMDLASLNIQRGRDHGLPPYNDYRKMCGLPVYESFDEMYESEPERAEMFRKVYDDISDVDIFPGGLSEKPLAGAVVGPTFACIMARQFQALKFGDRYWYESQDGPGAFKPDQLAEIRKMTIGRIMCMVAEMRSMPVNPLYKAGAFLPAGRGVLLPNNIYITQNRYVPCDDLPDLDYTRWYDPGAQLSG